MSLTNGDFSAADLAAVVGNNNDGFGGSNGAWWLLILLLFAGNGWGNGGWNNGGGRGDMPIMPPYATQNDVQAGFNQAAVVNGLNGINAAISGGFAGAEISRANTLANLTGQMNNIAMAQQGATYENRAAVADLKYTVATEACADRAAVTDALYNVTTASNVNTQAILTAINNGIQSLQDKLCQQEIDALKAQNANLQTQLNLAALRGSQEAQTAALERYLSPAPVPAYVVNPPFNYMNGCGCNNGCGCGN